MNTKINSRYPDVPTLPSLATNDLRCYHFYISHAYMYLGLFLDFSASLNNVHKLVYTYLIIKSLECIGI